MGITPLRSPPPTIMSSVHFIDRWFRIALLLLVPATASTARADLLVYRLPGTVGAEIVLQGRVTANPGGTVSFLHPKFGTLYFGLKDVVIHKVPTTREQFDRMLGRAKDAQASFEAAVWALKHGLLREHEEGVKRTLEQDRNHREAAAVMKLKKQIDQPLGDSSQQERELRALVTKPGMKVAKSDHFILLHDTSDKPAPEHKLARAQERLELLEEVYESFLLLFYAKGVELEIPSERMKVVLFNDFKDYTSFSTGLDSSLASAAGFWDPQRNVSVFYDHGTDDMFQALQRLSSEMQSIAKEAIRLKGPATKDIVRFANTLELLVQVAQENEDIKVVSHEATHQMAGNTGLFPRQVRVPAWVHEGLATYFEAPDDATWSGIGAVNARRLEWYRGLERDRQHSNIDFIVGDQIFDYAASHGAKLHGYGQAWALTHFLVERHFDKLLEYYRLLGELPRDVQFNSEVLSRVFTHVFGDNRQGLDQEWRAYMNGLQTDVNRVLGRGF
jgi:hypothetical protein